MDRTNKKKDEVVITVYLESEAYGCEKFSYSTIDEASAGVARLLKSVKKNVLNDGITRKISISVSKDELSI